MCIFKAIKENVFSWGGFLFFMLGHSSRDKVFTTPSVPNCWSFFPFLDVPK
ncbi:hypothetical protein LguiA_036637 [Lonicera macranthoides]